MSREESSARSQHTAAADLDALLGAAVDAIVTIDADGNVTSFNAAAERMFGYTAAEMIGHPVTRLMGEPYCSEHSHYLERYLATGERHVIGIGREVEAVKRSGERFPIALSVGEAVSGGQRRFVGFIRDLSRERAAEQERRSLEERLAHVGRFSLMGEMAAGIAHEINQPLSAITTYAQAAARLLNVEEPDNEALHEACTGIAKQAHRASQVIENLRNFVRKHDVRHESIDVNRVVRDVLPLVAADARTAGVPLDVELTEDLPAISGDAVELQQVLLNLTRNAVDAMREIPDKREGLGIKTRRDGEDVEIVVTDCGTGVSKRVAGTVFDPFVTTKREGLGVGLAISRRIIDAHEGTLSFRGRPGGGTIFTMALPVRKKHAENDGE